MGEKYKVGYLTGFFDILHEGHITILKEAKSQCDFLIVGVGTDEFMLQRKHRESVLNYSQRVAIVEAIKYVDKVVPELNLDKISDYQKYHFDVMFAGDDHKTESIYIQCAKTLKREYGVDTIYVKRNGTSSSKVRERARMIEEEHISDYQST